MPLRISMFLNSELTSPIFTPSSLGPFSLTSWRYDRADMPSLLQQHSLIDRCTMAHAAVSHHGARRAPQRQEMFVLISDTICLRSWEAARKLDGAIHEGSRWVKMGEVDHRTYHLHWQDGHNLTIFDIIIYNRNKQILERAYWCTLYRFDTMICAWHVKWQVASKWPLNTQHHTTTHK